MALRKIDTAPPPPVDDAGQPPDPLHQPPSFQPDQKSPPFIDASPKPPLSPVESFQRASSAEKAHLSQLSPKPLLKDLPPKPAPGNRPSPTPAAPETQRSRTSAAESQSSIQQGEPSPRGAAEGADGAGDAPVPLPRKIGSVSVFRTERCF